MAGSNLIKFQRPEVLRELTFGNLMILLQKFADYFKMVHFTFDGCTEENFDYEALSRILADRMFVGEFSEVFAAFGLIGAMSSDSRADTLREYIDKQSYANEVTEKMTTADLALLVYLHDPVALNDIDVQFNATKKRSFAMRGTKRDLSGLVVSKENIAEFQRLMNEVFSQRHRGNTARIYPPTEEGDDLYIIVRHGDSFKRQGAVADGPKSMTLAFQPESFDLLVINRKNSELRICVPSSPAWLEDAYAGNLSKALFNNYVVFSEKRNNNLARIKELGRNVTIYRGEAEVKRIDLVRLSLTYSPDSMMPVQFSATDGDLFKDFESARCKLENMGTIFEAQFAVKIGCREKIITLKNNNRSGYDYDEFGVVVDEWLRSVGIIQVLKTQMETKHVEGIDAVGPIALAM